MKNTYFTNMVFSLFLIGFAFSIINGQTITPDLPEKIDASKNYLFYLHGGVVQDQGANAVSEYYGRYEYQKILDTLKDSGFNVISEVRPKGTDEATYAIKVRKQINALLKRGVVPENIIVVGASLGAYITVETAYKLKNEKVKYAILGLCSKYAVSYYQKYKKKLRGNFLSIYESSDDKKSCKGIFTPKPKKASFKEIKLEMRNSHGFLFKPYDEWVTPLVEWAKNDD